MSGDDRGLTELPLGYSRLVLAYHRNQHMAKAVLGTVEHCELLFVIIGLTLYEEVAEVRLTRLVLGLYGPQSIHKRLNLCSK